MTSEGTAPPIRTVTATRYVTPLRQGGSLPAIVEADDDGMYVLKFRGAGQGPRALIAELIAGEIARAAGLPMPEIVFVELDPDMARTEPDPEIQDQIRASAGLNLALDYLPGAVMFDAVAERPDAALASEIVWFDALLTNIDRTPHNTNMMIWHRKLWLIDHGAALYAQHNWDTFLENSRSAFSMIKDHVLLPMADTIHESDEKMTALITPEVIRAVVRLIPDRWLEADKAASSAEAQRETYISYLLRRLEPPHDFLEEAIRARALHV